MANGSCTGEVSYGKRVEHARKLCQTLKGHVSKEHVHLLVSIPPQVTISRLVQRLTGKTASKLWQESAPLRKQFWGRHLWARGYFCCSSGNVTDEVVAEYRANQGKPGPGDFRVEGEDFEPASGGWTSCRASLGTGLES